MLIDRSERQSGADKNKICQATSANDRRVWYNRTERRRRGKWNFYKVSQVARYRTSLPQSVLCACRWASWHSGVSSHGVVGTHVRVTKTKKCPGHSRQGYQDPRESTGPPQKGAPDEPPKEPLCGPLRSPYFCPLLGASQSPSLHTQWDPLGRVELRALHFFLRRESGNFLFYAMVSGE